MDKNVAGLIFRTPNTPQVYFLTLDFFEGEDTYHVLMFDERGNIQYDKLTIHWVNSQTSQGALETVDFSKFSKNQPHILEKVIVGIFEVLHGRE